MFAVGIVWKQKHLYEDDHKDALEKEGRKKVLVDGNPRHSQNSVKTNEKYYRIDSTTGIRGNHFEKTYFGADFLEIYLIKLLAQSECGF